MHLITVFIVNLTLHMVSRQLKKKIRLETRKQDESCQNIQDARERERERRREKNQVGKEKRLRKKNKKKKKKCFEEEIVDVSFESNINTVVEKHLIRNYAC